MGQILKKLSKVGDILKTQSKNNRVNNKIDFDEIFNEKIKSRKKKIIRKTQIEKEL